MTKRNGRPLADGLDGVLNSPVKMRIARMLTDLPEKGFTGRELARLLGVSHSSVQDAMRIFVSSGLAVRSTVGRAHLFKANKESYLFGAIQGLFRKERRLHDDMVNELRATFGGEAISVVLFGSYARGDENPKSDIDVIVVSTDLASSEGSVQELGARFIRRYGVRLSAKVLAPDDLKKKWNSPYVKAARREGLVIAGKPLPEAMKGGD